jgi:hypothetical protein
MEYGVDILYLPGFFGSSKADFELLRNFGSSEPKMFVDLKMSSKGFL